MELTSELMDNGFVLPEYGNSNLSVIKGIASGRKGIVGAGEKTIFLVVDGLGYNLVEDMLNGPNASLVNQAHMEKISTLFPSTTVLILNSLESGLTPAEHGLIGWDVYYKEFGVVITPYRDSIAFSRRASLSQEGMASVLAKPTILEKAAHKGSISIVYPDDIKNIRTIENSRNVSYHTSADLMVKLKKIVEKGDEWFVYAYYPSIDHLEHKNGYSSESVKQGVLSLFRDLNQILASHLKKSGYNLVITSDHGQIEAKKKIIIKSGDEIMRYISMPPWGDSRVMCLSALPGKEDSLTRFFERKYGNDALLVESDSLIHSGIFGKRAVSDRLRHRFGTHMILMKDNGIIKYQYPLEKPRKFDNRGFHSGMSELEMKIPLLVYQ
jgi:predicted AlkP superfamily pyrophosphatase or phosphodiesterase